MERKQRGKVTKGATPAEERITADRFLTEEDLRNAAKLSEVNTADQDTKEYTYVPYGTTTFADYDSSMAARKVRDEVYNLSLVFEQLMSNVLYDSETADKAKAMSDLVAEYARRTKALVATKEQTAPPETTKEETTTQATTTQTADGNTSDLFLFKEESGRLRWFAVYSNNYRDDDGIPEIISEKSHNAFAYLVKEGILPYPELWHWHIPGTRWGVADHLDYANGMAYATGLVDEGHEKEAEVLAGMDVLVSHGMPVPYILRDETDPTIIDFHITREISPLPAKKAANKITGFITH